MAFNRNEHTEMLRARHRPPQLTPQKKNDHAEIESLTEQFLASGGKISSFPLGATRWSIVEENRKAESIRGGAASKKQLEKSLGMGAAARYIGMNYKTFKKHCEQNTGPYYQMHGNKRRFLASDLLEWDQARKGN